MEVLRNERTKKIYLHTEVQLYIILVIYMDNDKGNGLHVHILELVLIERTLKIYFPNHTILDLLHC